MARSRLAGTDAPRIDPLEPRQLFTVYTPTPLADLYADPPNELFSLSPPAGVETVGYGAAGATLGDVDGDGAHDFAIAAPGRVASSGAPAVNGYVFLYSGRTQSLVATIAGTAPGFGAVLASAGDFNNDGVSDLFVGSPASAAAALYSGATGDLLHALTGDADSEFGFSFTRTDDLNADGTADFAVGAPAQGGTGAVFTFSGTDVSQLRRIDGSQAGSRYGHAIATWGNLTDQVTPRDGVRELFIGVPEWDTFRDGATITAAGSLVLVEPISGVQLQDYQGIYADGHVGTSLLATQDRLRVGAPAGPATPAAWIGGWVLRVGAATAPGVWFSIVPDTFRSDVPGTRLGEWLGVAPSFKGTLSTMLLIGNGAGAGTTLVTGDGDAFAVQAQRVLAGDFNADGIPDILGLGWTTPPDGGVRAVSATQYVPLRPEFDGFSRSGAYAWSSRIGGSQWYQDFFVATSDTVIVGAGIPALAADRVRVQITAVSDTGVIAGYLNPQGPGDVAVPFLLDLAQPQTRLDLENLVTAVVGGTPNYATLRVRFFGPTGDAFLSDESGDGLGGAWKLSGTTLTRMWTGVPTDQRGDGTVLGLDFASGTSVATTWTEADGARQIVSLADVWQFAPDGAILGRSREGDLVIERNGTFTRVRGHYTGSTGSIFAGWSPIGVDGAGHIVFQALIGNRVFVPPSRGSPGGYFNQWRVSSHMIDVTGAPYLLSERVSGPGSSDFGLPLVASAYPYGGRESIRLLPDGRILTQTHVLTPVPDSAVGGETLTAAPTPAAPGSLGVTSGGMPFSVRLGSGGQWVTRLYPQLDQSWASALYYDPKDGQNYVVAFGQQRLSDGRGATGVVYRQASDGSLVDPIIITTSAADAIRRSIVVFFSADQRVHIAGISEGGGLMMFYQSTARLPDGSLQWGADNISANHFFANGIDAPRWGSSSQLTAYSTAWGGLNVAGVDVSGQVQVSWWAPGMQFWALDNLTTNAGLPLLTGPLTSYVTPWNGLNIAGFDAQGDIQVAWWVPGFGTQWRKDNLTDDISGLKLTTISSFVNAWGGMNIAGIDRATGQPAVYWWTPSTNQWVSQLIPLTGAPSPWPGTRTSLKPVLMGGQQNLIGLSDDTGDVVRLYWNPGDGSEWTIENLTRLSL